MPENAKQRLIRLEGFVPSDLVVIEDDGTALHYQGTVLEFLTQAEQEFRGGGGDCADAVMRSVGASANLGRLHELMRAVWTPVLEAKGKS